MFPTSKSNNQVNCDANNRVPKLIVFRTYVSNLTITNSTGPIQTLPNIFRLSLVVEIIYSWWWFWILRFVIFCVLLLHQTRNQFFCSLFIILWIYLFNHDYIFVFHGHCFILFQLYIHQQNLRTNQNRLNWLERWPLVQIPTLFFEGSDVQYFQHFN